MENIGLTRIRPKCDVIDGNSTEAFFSKKWHCCPKNQVRLYTTCELVFRLVLYFQMLAAPKRFFQGGYIGRSAATMFWYLTSYL